MEDMNKNLIESEKIKIGQWKKFAQTDAFKDLIEYMDFQRDAAVTAAIGPVEPYGIVNTNSGNYSEQLQIDPEKTAYLLQRCAGYDIIRLYVDGYVNN